MKKLKNKALGISLLIVLLLLATHSGIMIYKMFNDADGIISILATAFMGLSILLLLVIAGLCLKSTCITPKKSNQNGKENQK